MPCIRYENLGTYVDLICVWKVYMFAQSGIELDGNISEAFFIYYCTTSYIYK